MFGSGYTLDPRRLRDGTGTTRFLREDGSFATPAGGNPLTFTAVFDGGNASPAAGTLVQVVAPVACTIVSATVIADQSGSAVVDVKKATYSGFPTTSSIAASAKPTLSSAQKSQDTTLTGWTTAVAAGDVLEFSLDSVSTCRRVAVFLKATVP